jgi:hypothetical protein
LAIVASLGWRLGAGFDGQNIHRRFRRTIAKNAWRYAVDAWRGERQSSEPWLNKRRPVIQIERVAIAALIPYVRNSRTHSDVQVAQIAASIREFGFTNPVLLDEANGIIAGHGRVLAACWPRASSGCRTFRQFVWRT